MPAPAAPTGFTLTQVGAEPRYTAEWSHTGTELHRFELLYKRDNDTVWKSYGMFLASDLLESGTTYNLEIVSESGVEWVVRALNSAGEVSG